MIDSQLPGLSYFDRVYFDGVYNFNWVYFDNRVYFNSLLLIGKQVF